MCLFVGWLLSEKNTGNYSATFSYPFAFIFMWFRLKEINYIYR